MPAITSENLALAIVKLLAAESLDALEPVFAMGNLVNRQYESTLAQAGDTVSVAIPPVLVANNVAESGSVSMQSATPGNAQVVLDTHAESSFTIPDVTKAIASMDVLKMYLQPALIAIATRMEQDILNHYARFVANPVLGGASTPITENTIEAAETKMFDAFVPAQLPKYLLVSSSAYSGIRTISRFTENQTNGDGSAITSGVLGQIKGFNVMRSQLVPFAGGAYQNLAFVKDAIALVTRKLPPPMAGTGVLCEYAEKGSFGMRVLISYNPNTLAQQFTVDALYGSGVLRNQFGQVIQS